MLITWRSLDRQWSPSADRPNDSETCAGLASKTTVTAQELSGDPLNVGLIGA